MSYTPIESGTWTPIVVNGDNVISATAYQGQWIKSGNVVNCSFYIEVTSITASSTLSDIYISLPVDSDFSFTYNASGTVFVRATPGLVGGVEGDVTTNTLHAESWINTSVKSCGWHGSATYLVI